MSKIYIQDDFAYKFNNFIIWKHKYWNAGMFSGCFSQKKQKSEPLYAAAAPAWGMPRAKVWIPA